MTKITSLMARKPTEYQNGQQLNSDKDLMFGGHSYLLYWRRLGLRARINRGNNHGGVYNGIKEGRAATQRELNFLSDLNGAGWRSLAFSGDGLHDLILYGGDSDVYNWGTKIIITFSILLYRFF